MDVCVNGIRCVYNIYIYIYLLMYIHPYIYIHLERQIIQDMGHLGWHRVCNFHMHA